MSTEKRTAAAAIEQLVDKLGETEAIEMLEFALPLIVERESNLTDQLLSGNLAEAAKYAHKTISSIRLYGSSELENLLQAVKDVKNHAQALALQPRLSKEFNLTINVVKNYLHEHTPANKI
jgi:hypothetical protein